MLFKDHFLIKLHFNWHIAADLFWPHLYRPAVWYESCTLILTWIRKTVLKILLSYIPCILHGVMTFSVVSTKNPVKHCSCLWTQMSTLNTSLSINHILWNYTTYYMEYIQYNLFELASHIHTHSKRKVKISSYIYS